MRRAILAGVVASWVQLVSATGASAGWSAPGPQRAVGSSNAVVLSIRYVSQTSESAPAWWRGPGTPYCVSATSAMVIDALGLALPERPLVTLFEIGHAANATNDPGIDPAGAVAVLERFGWGGRIEDAGDSATALALLTSEVGRGAPVIALTKAGTHAVVVYGYERDARGDVARIYAADPLSGWIGPIPVSRWLAEQEWWGLPFRAPGPEWQGRYVVIVPVTEPLFSDPFGPRLL